MNFRIIIFSKSQDEGDQEGIILTSDEVNSIKYKTRTAEYKNFANTDSEVRVRITGKMISQLKVENNSADSFPEMNSMLEDYKNNNLGNNLSLLKKLYQEKFKSVSDKVFQGIEKFDLSNFYEHNKKNIISLTKWALDYKSNGEYKDVIVEINLGDEKTIALLFENMYVENFEQEFDIEKGNGEFLLELKQKYYSGNKIRIE